MIEDDEDVPRDISLQKSKTHHLSLLQKNTPEESPSFAVCSVRKKKFKLFSLLQIKIFLSSFSPFLCLYEKSFCSLFLGVWRHNKSCCWCCVPKSTLSHSHSLSNSITLSLKNKRVQNEEEEAEED